MKSTEIKNKQYELFTHFVSNNINNVSNTFDFWDSIPKYHLSSAQASKLLVGNGIHKRGKISFKFKEEIYVLKIQPAQVNLNGKEKSFFPGVSEGLVEDALIKILSNQIQGFHDPIENETWVKFSLNRIKKELDGNHTNRRALTKSGLPKRTNQINHTKSTNQIKHALKVLSRSVLTLYRENEEIWSGTILQNLITVDREKYLKDKNSYHAAKLSPFVTAAINNGDYRQFEYALYMSLKLPLSRWLYKRLVNRYKQACISLTYNILFSTIKSESALLEQASDRDNRKKVIATLNELKSNKILINYESDFKKDKRKIIDVTYNLTTSNTFTQQQKASNKRASQNDKLLF